ncbi:hypothetical protein PG996_015077 [Apiospora saccharicola]|uniref:AB hydrolase-1 domain-containing protein n=1 Tax=Apiospora saccharicola TaxID=335842 RepID=A0ABR1TMW0_9PEZI
MSKPVIVVVPGAWQKPVAFTGFVQKLQTAGYEATHVALPTVGGTELPLAGLAEDVAAVRTVLQKIAGEGKNALVIGHSSGGLVGSNAIAGQDNVVGIIYLSGFMIPAGKALLDMLGGQPLPWMDVQGDRVVGVPEMIPQVAYNDMEGEEQTKWAKEMTHTSAALLATPSGHEPWASGTTCGYIHCSDDNALPFLIQQQMVAQMGPSPKTVTLEIPLYLPSPQS